MIAGGRERSALVADVQGTSSRPVMLATIEVPFEPRAAQFAVDTAVESGQPLIVATAVEIPLGPATIFLGYGDIDPPPEDAAALSEPAKLAHALGVRVERLRLKTPHPVDALLELAAERGLGLLVFGPDRGRLRRRVYRKAVKALRERASCLVWIAD